MTKEKLTSIIEALTQEVNYKQLWANKWKQLSKRKTNTDKGRSADLMCYNLCIGRRDGLTKALLLLKGESK